jgi:short-subunit dehydrogenase involved in D-alanine esterification of teichoic acids
MRFTGKRILIDGATSGIGLVGAHRIAAEGGRLILTGTNLQRITDAQAALPDARVLRNDAGAPDAAEALA